MTVAASLSAWGPLAAPGTLNPSAGPLATAQQPGESRPEFWMRRLSVKLAAQQAVAAKYEAYYSGDHPVPWLPDQRREEFRYVLRLTRTNYMGLVVDAQVERMMLTGFRLDGSQASDDATWRLWTDNHLDSDFDLGILEAGKGGTAFLMVGPGADGAPVMSVEHMSQVAIAYTPGSRRDCLAAAKVWADEWTGKRLAELHTPEYIFAFSQASGLGSAWKWRLGDYRPNPIGEVGVFELPNNPQALTGGRSELYDVVEIQDRINKTVLDRLMTQDSGAWPFKWAVGYPNDADPVAIGRNRMLTTDVSKTDAAFGQFEAAQLDPYSMAKREDVRDVAARTRTPAQYLLGEMNNVNGETLKASEAGLISKVRQRTKPMSEGVEGAVRLARKLANLPPASVRAVWRNPEHRTEGELTDSLVKMRTLGVPLEALWERWGATPEEIKDWQRKLVAEREAAALADPELAAIASLTNGANA